MFIFTKSVHAKKKKHLKTLIGYDYFEKFLDFRTASIIKKVDL